MSPIGNLPQFSTENYKNGFFTIKKLQDYCVVLFLHLPLGRFRVFYRQVKSILVFYLLKNHCFPALNFSTYFFFFKFFLNEYFCCKIKLRHTRVGFA